jgi:ABC-2 type transport system ATP-binding protein
MSAIVQLQNLSVHLGKRLILNGLNAELKGRTIGLLGPNGAGKSTLINTLLGFYAPSSGTARIFGMETRAEAKKVRSIVGYMPENDSFIADMSAVTFIRMMAELSGLPPEAALERAHECLFYVGLGEARYRKLGTYSLGMKQLAKLAQAIVHGPKLVILDEPTNGLDPPARRRMLNMIREMRDNAQMHIILCSHLLRDVEDTCEEVLILKQGAIVHYADLEAERRANKRFVELETVGDDQGFASRMETLGATIAEVGMGRWKMVLPPEFNFRDLYAAASETDLELRKVNYRKDTLEDIFLKAMSQT